MSAGFGLVTLPSGKGARVWDADAYAWDLIGQTRVYPGGGMVTA